MPLNFKSMENNMKLLEHGSWKVGFIGHKIKKVTITVICSLIPALVFILAAMFTGINGMITLFFTSIIYGITQYLCLINTGKSDFLIRIILSVIFRIAFMYITWHKELFYHFYIHFYSENPSAGTGFGLIISFILNTIILLLALSVASQHIEIKSFENNTKNT